MRTWLLGFSWKEGTDMGFGNAYVTHDDDRPLTQKDIRECEEWASTTYPGRSIVIISFSELEK